MKRKLKPQNPKSTCDHIKFNEQDNKCGGKTTFNITYQALFGWSERKIINEKVRKGKEEKG